MSFQPIEFKDNGDVILLDQRELPLKEEFIVCSSLETIHAAIRDMVVRGAPCIGFTAILGLAIWLKNNKYEKSLFLEACNFLETARPTAVNLSYEIQRVRRLVLESENKENCYELVKSFGLNQIKESELKNRKMANLASAHLKKLYGYKKLNVLTHCNTGFLACGSIGTALGVIQALGEEQRINNVWVDETRPYMQGSRLTSYELTKLKIPHKIVVEGAASYLMREKLVDAVFVGADRIVANGDTANKIGTSTLAVVAKYYNVPFFVVAPSSSFDLESKTGEQIEIELRAEDEILKWQGKEIAPLNAKALNPSFDITEGSLITGIINENGIALGNYDSALKEIVV